MTALPPVFVGAIAAFFIGLFFILFAVLLHAKGDVFYLWVYPVPYWPRIRRDRLVRVKLERFIVETLDENLKKLFDETIFQKDAKGKFIMEENKLKAVDDISDELVSMWRKIRSSPNDYTFWLYRFKKRWRLPSGTRGRLVHVYSLFSLEEMVQKLGRKRIIRGILLNSPLSVHAPLKKKEWVEKHLAEDQKKGIKATPERIKAYKSAYRRVNKQKWLSLIFHPTMLTATKEAEVHERIQGFNAIFAFVGSALKKFKKELAEYPYLKHFADNTKETIRTLEGQIHKLSDIIGHDHALIQELNLTIKKLRTPTVVSPESAPVPSSPFEQPKPAPQPSFTQKLFSHQTDELKLALWGLFFLGGFAFVVGLILVNPGIGILGVVMMLAGILGLLWKRKVSIKIPEAVSEKVEEATSAVKEAVTEE